MAKRKSLPEAVTGGHVRLPFEVLNSTASTGASHRAKALLLELARQLNGRNNGRLQLSASWLKKRGWLSADQIQKAKIELLERGLIIQTRQGGLNIGASLYAVTWLHITNFAGLDISSQYHPGHWRFLDKLDIPKAQEEFRKKASAKCERSPVSWNSAAPCGGVEDSAPTPCGGAKTARLGDVAAPPRGDNVVTKSSVNFAAAPPVPSDRTAPAPAVEEADIRALVESVARAHAFTDDERAEALETALKSPVAALASLRAMTAPQNTYERPQMAGD